MKLWHPNDYEMIRMYSNLESYKKKNNQKSKGLSNYFKKYSQTAKQRDSTIGLLAFFFHLESEIWMLEC